MMYILEKNGKKVHVVNRRTRAIESSHDNMGDAKAAMRKAFAVLDARKTKRVPKSEEGEPVADVEAGEG